MELKRIKKLTITINTLILILVFGLAGFFLFCRASFLVWFSIPTALVYIIGYYLIHIERLDIYVRAVYFWLTLYMSIATVCLGYRFGFHLYCMSMIPIIFYTEYMAEKLGKKKINALAVSAVIVICYLCSTGYSAYAGAIYDVDDTTAGLFWLFNSGIVLFFLITYSMIMLRMVGDYEGRLAAIAHTDRLTGLYNRHFMLDRLEVACDPGSKRFVAMVDIDDFKSVNDTYGHSAGDEVLKKVSDLMREVCGNSDISRWGGEEFLILSEGSAEKEGFEMIETLRKRAEECMIKCGEETISITVTSGLSDLKAGYSVDEWIKEADDRLYYGKKNGKNKVILDIGASSAG